jgi:hypothetical protein
MGWSHPAAALAFGRAAKRAGVARGDLGLVRAGKNLEQEAIARHSMFLSDTCESGSLTGDQAETSGAARIAALEKLSEATGRIVLTASTEMRRRLKAFRAYCSFV